MNAFQKLICKVFKIKPKVYNDCTSLFINTNRIDDICVGVGAIANIEKSTLCVKKESSIKHPVNDINPEAGPFQHEDKYSIIVTYESEE